MDDHDKLKSLTARVLVKRTICEVHREMYDIIDAQFKDSPYYTELVEKLEEAYLMAKKMNTKLKQYRNNYDRGWWEEQSKEMVKEKLAHRSTRK